MTGSEKFTVDKVECPVCKGLGKEFVFHNTGPDYRKHFSLHETCLACSGSGKISAELATKIKKRNRFWDEIIKKIE